MSPIDSTTRRLACGLTLLCLTLLAGCALPTQKPPSERMSYDCSFDIDTFRVEGTEPVDIAGSVSLYQWLKKIIEGGIMSQPGFSLSQSISNTYVQGAKAKSDGRVAQVIWLIPAALSRSGADYLVEQRGVKLIAIEVNPAHSKALGFTDAFYSPRRNRCYPD